MQILNVNIHISYICNSEHRETVLIVETITMSMNRWMDKQSVA